MIKRNDDVDLDLVAEGQAFRRIESRAVEQTQAESRGTELAAVRQSPDRRMYVNTKALVAMWLGIMLAPLSLAAQSGVRVESHDDEMESWTYAYTRADHGPVLTIDDRGITFGRSPCLIFLCTAGGMEVVYCFDTELIGEAGTVLVQSRFDSRQASKPEPWPTVVDPSDEGGLEAAAAAMGVDETNAFLEMFGSTVRAAGLSGEDVEAFLTEAASAEQVTMRVTDQFDGETHTDVFSLEGLTDALEQIRATCER